MSARSGRKRRPLPPPWVVRRFFRFRNMVGRAHVGMVPPELMLLERSFGLVHNKVLMLAAELGIADQLEQGPKTAEELAGIVGANPEALDRMHDGRVSAGWPGRAGLRRG